MSGQNEKALAKPEARRPSPVDLMAIKIYDELARRDTNLANLLPPTMSVDRFKEGFRFALANEPKLLKCSPASVMIAVMRAAKMGIDIAGGTLGHGFLVPYGEECQLVPGYKGLVALAVYAGVVQDMTPQLVYEKDKFRPREGDNPRITHEPYVPTKKGESRGEIIAAYTQVLLPSGTRVVKGLMYLDDIARIEAGVKAGKSPWNGPHRPEMVKKSSIRNGFKTLGVPEGERAHYLREALRADAEAEYTVNAVEQEHSEAVTPAESLRTAARQAKALPEDSTATQRLEQPRQGEHADASNYKGEEPPEDMALPGGGK